MIGISCPGFSMTPFSDMLKVIASHFDCWEIIAEGEHTMSEIQDAIRESRGSYDTKFKVHAPFSDLNIASLNERIRSDSIEQVMDTIRISSELDIEMVSVHPGYRSPLAAYFPEKAFEVHKKSLAELDEAGKEHGVILALENIPKMWISLCSTADDMKELITGTELKVCFDIGHAYISDDVEGFLSFGDRIVNMHVHDNNGKVDRHQVIGKGEINFVGILESLEDYSGDYIIESMNLEEGIQSKRVLDGLMRCG